MTALKSQPDNDLELIQQEVSPESDEQITKSGSDYVKRAIEDFQAAIEISQSLDCKEVDKVSWIKPRLWLARAKLKNNQVHLAIQHFTDAQYDDG